MLLLRLATNARQQIFISKLLTEVKRPVSQMLTLHHPPVFPIDAIQFRLKSRAKYQKYKAAAIALRKEMLALGFAAGDGDCGFITFAAQLNAVFGVTTWTMDRVRLEIATWMKQGSNLLQLQTIWTDQAAVSLIAWKPLITAATNNACSPFKSATT